MFPCLSHGCLHRFQSLSLPGRSLAPYDSHCCPYRPSFPTSPSPPSIPTAKNLTSCAGRQQPGCTTPAFGVSIPASLPLSRYDTLPAQVRSPKHRDVKCLASINTLLPGPRIAYGGTTLLSLPFPHFQPTAPGLLLGAGVGKQSAESISRLLVPSPTCSAAFWGILALQKSFPSPGSGCGGLPALIPETVTAPVTITRCSVRVCTSASPTDGKLRKGRTVCLHPVTPIPSLLPGEAQWQRSQVLEPGSPGCTEVILPFTRGATLGESANHSEFYFLIFKVDIH